MVSAPALKGDQFVSKRVDFPINITRAAGGGDIKIDALGIKSDVAVLDITGSVPQQALQNLANQKPPGATGIITIKADVPSFAAIAKMLPHVTHVKDGVAISGGGLTNVVKIDLVADGVKATQSLALSAEGTSAGKPIRLDKTTFDSSAGIAVTAGQPIGVASVRSFTLALVAPFANVQGQGVPDKIELVGGADLKRFQDDVAQFVDLGTLALDGTAKFSLNTNGLPTDTTSPLGLTGNLDLQKLVVSQAGTTYLDHETVNGDIDLLYKQTSNGKTITFKKLAVKTETGLFDLAMQGDSAWLMIADNGAFGGEAKLSVGAALDRLLAPFLDEMDPDYRLTRGRLGGTITLATDAAKDQYSLVGDFGINRLTVGSLLKEETVKFGVTAIVPQDMGAMQTWFELASSFANAKGEADVRLPKEGVPGGLELVRKASFTGDVPSLPKLYALAASMNPTPPANGADGKPLPPLKVQSGTLTFDGGLTRGADGRRSRSPSTCRA